MSIGARLKAERVRLGLSQGTMGKIGGVQTNAQGLYENGARFPRADFLAKVAAAGVDVLFVITGERTQKASANSAEALDSALEFLDKARKLIQ